HEERAPADCPAGRGGASESSGSSVRSDPNSCRGYRRKGRRPLWHGVAGRSLLHRRRQLFSLRPAGAKSPPCSHPASPGSNTLSQLSLRQLLISDSTATGQVRTSTVFRGDGLATDRLGGRGREPADFRRPSKQPPAASVF